MARGELVGIGYSPWSEKARWALDHHHVDYRETPFAAMISTPKLRLRLRKFRGRVTAPVYFAPGQPPLTDSWDIAMYAESVGTGPSLFPDDNASEIATWNAESERAMASGRALVTNRVAQDPQALDESLPRGIPKRLRPALRPMTRLGVRYLTRKYELDALDDCEHRELVRGVLMSMRETLAETGDYLLGTFSYADIVMASALQFVVPVANEYMRVGRRSRVLWTDDALAAEFPDIIAWRDTIYETKRRAS